MLKQLRSYQKDALLYTNSHCHRALYMEMRLGKTLIVIRKVKIENGKLNLVIGPYSVLSGWIDQLTEDNEKNIIVIEGTKEKRKQIVFSITKQECRQWVLTNIESHASVPEIAGIQWDNVILDESVVIKNPKAAITKFFIKYFRSVKHRWVLCGTPAPENELEYYCQMKFLDPKIFNVPNYYRFRNKFFTTNDRSNFDYNITTEGKAFISNRLSENAFFLNRNQANLGGVKIRETRMVFLPSDVRKVYEKLEEEMILLIDDILIDKTVWATQAYIWMRKICGGKIADGVYSKHKTNELNTLINGELKGQQLVIFCHFTEEIDLLHKEIKNSDYIYGAVKPSERVKKIKSFQSGKIQHLIVQPRTVSFGVNLSAANSMIFYSTPESATIRNQAEDRNIDVSKNDSTLIIDLICNDTIEEEIQFNQLKKDAKYNGLRSLVNSLKKRKNLQ